jgi:hypothetical protein
MTLPPCPIFFKYFSMSYRCTTSRFRSIYHVYDIPEFSDEVYKPGKSQSAPLLTPSSSLPTPLPILLHAPSRYTYYPPATIYLLHPPDYSIYVSRTSSTPWHPPLPLLSHFAFLPLGTTALYQYSYINITHMYIHYLVVVMVIFDRFFIHK